MILVILIRAMLLVINVGGIAVGILERIVEVVWVVHTRFILVLVKSLSKVA